MHTWQMFRKKTRGKKKRKKKKRKKKRRRRGRRREEIAQPDVVKNHAWAGDSISKNYQSDDVDDDDLDGESNLLRI